MDRAVGINLIGDLTAEDPFGQLARAFLRALDEARIPVALVDPGEDGPFSVDLICAAGLERPSNGRTVWSGLELPTPVALPPNGVWPDRQRFGLPDGWLVLALSAAEELEVATTAGDHVLTIPDGLTEWEQTQLIASIDIVIARDALPLAVGRAMALGRGVVTAEQPGGVADTDRAWIAHGEEQVAAAIREICGGGPAVERRLATARTHAREFHSPKTVGAELERRLRAVSAAPGGDEVLALATAQRAERRLDDRIAELSRRVEDVAVARDDLEDRVRHVLRDVAAPPGHVVTEARPIAALTARSGADLAPWSLEYNAEHRALVAEAIAAPDLEAHFAPDGELPARWGIGLDERVVELPWLFAEGLRGTTLDAGSALNHSHLLDPLLRRVTTLDVVTLAPEPWSFPELGISYVYADLRDLPYRSGHFDTITCVSTLDHVGMDNTRYGADAPAAPDPATEVRRAVAELVRVLAPGGVLLLTVPYGTPSSHGWLRQFGRAEVEALAGQPGLQGAVTVFAYGPDGWQHSSLEAAAGAAYHDAATAGGPADDGAVAARAVACIRLQRA